MIGPQWYPFYVFNKIFDNKKCIIEKNILLKTCQEPYLSVFFYRGIFFIPNNSKTDGFDFFFLDRPYYYTPSQILN